MVSAASQTLVVSPGRRPRTVVHDGAVLEVPDRWELLGPGDAGLTRRVKGGGPTWTEKETKGRRTFSLGVWAPADRIEAARAAIEAERETPEYRRKLAADRARRERAHQDYAVEFELEVRTFLDFAPRYRAIEGRIAAAVAAHATPVGSGTVARTKRIGVAERAEAAVIAWLRHQTTAYDRMRIERVKGRRREVRRELARESRRLLTRYRRGEAPAPGCPLWAAMGESERVVAPVAGDASGERDARDPNNTKDAPVDGPRPRAPLREAEAEAVPAAVEPNAVAAEAEARDAKQRELYEQVRARLMRR